MTEAEGNLSDSKVMKRRESSLIDHINRIRSANSKRQFVSLWGTLEDQKPSLEYKKKDSMSKSVSMSEFPHRLPGKSVLRQSYESFDPENFEENNFNDSSGIPYDKKISLDSVKKKKTQRVDTLRPQRTSKERQTTKANIKEDLSKENAKQTEKNITKKSAPKIIKKEKTVQRSKPIKQKTKSVSKDAKDQENTKNIDKKIMDESLIDDNYDFKKSAYQMVASIINSGREITSKDILILKWLQELHSPESDKSNVRGDVINFDDNQGDPIRILKMPFSPEHKEKKSFGSESLENSLTKDVSEENMMSKVSDTPKSKEHQSEEGMSVSVEKRLKPSDVEMSVSELQKLHIVLNLKSLSPEDTAVIIWLDSLPKSTLEPNFRKSLSISSFSDIQETSFPTFNKQSIPAEEDDISPRPKISFPSVTILKNLSVDSKGKLRNLKDDFSNVYYKRCNLNPIE